MDYKVIWDDEAIKESGQIVSSIDQINPVATRKNGESILGKVKQPGAFPQLGKRLRNLRREDVREFTFAPFRIIYYVKDNESSVRILKIWHGARREPEIK
jgi:plasmid stabilization system protein ParE